MNKKENINTKKLTAKKRIRMQIVEYLSDPNNAFFPWARLCTEVFHYKSSRYFYKLFTPEERRKIEQEALAERRKSFSRISAAVDHGLARKAMSGEVAAAKLWYQRIEGWSEKQLHDDLDDSVLQRMALLIFNVTMMKSMSNDERAKVMRERMIKELGEERIV
jgi:hypothetical protein